MEGEIQVVIGWQEHYQTLINAREEEIQKAIQDQDEGMLWTVWYGTVCYGPSALVQGLLSWNATLRWHSYLLWKYLGTEMYVDNVTRGCSFLIYCVSICVKGKSSLVKLLSQFVGTK